MAGLVYASAEDAENGAAQFQAACLTACREGMRSSAGIRTRGRAGNQQWWTAELDRLRQDARRTRRRWQREPAGEARELWRSLYREKRREYKNQIKKARKESFREICTRAGAADKNPWGMAHQIIKAGRGKRAVQAPLGTVEKPGGGWTETEQETLSVLLARYFPSSEGPRDRDVNINEEGRVINEGQAGDRAITSAEIKNAAKSFNPKKASGRDGIPTAALTHIVEVGGRELADIFNACWQHGVFPRVWKEARVVWLPKPGGDVRPICLLPVVGKILDKIIAGRLQYFAETSGKFAENQYGFRYGRSTREAIEKLVARIKDRKQAGMHSLIVTLDIKNAFNSIEHDSVGNELRAAGYPRGLREIAISFLRERTVYCGEASRAVDRGCPQGSCSGPVLWLIAMEGWFRGAGSAAGTHIQAYADDQVVVISAPSVKKIEASWRETWVACSNWAYEVGLEYNANKTEATLVKARGIMRGPEIRMGEHRIEVGLTIKYLGIIIDAGLKWIEQVRAARGKTAALANRLFIVAGKTWGTSPEMLKTIYRGVVVPILLYGAEIWGVRGRDVRTERHLNAAQRPFLLAITGAYRTAPTAALQVLAGLQPLYLEAAYAHAEAVETAEGYENKPNARGLVHPADRGTINYGEWRENAEVESRNREIYTDGARREGKTGCAFVIREKGAEWEEPVGHRMGDHATIAQAELRAIQEAVGVAVGRAGDTDVISDSRFALDAVVAVIHRNAVAREIYRDVIRAGAEGKKIRLWWVKAHQGNEGNRRADEAAGTAIEGDIDIPYANAKARSLARRERREGVRREWQRRWDAGNTGRLLHAIVGAVDIEIGNISRNAVHLLTGHGRVAAYYTRFKLREGDDICECGEDRETAAHILWDCTVADRAQARETLRDRAVRLGATWPLCINRETKPEIWAEISEFAGRVLREDINEE